MDVVGIKRNVLGMKKMESNRVFQVDFAVTVLYPWGKVVFVCIE